jgi:hypothetical protein
VANFENGMLEVRLPKAEAVKPRQIKIQARAQTQLGKGTSQKGQAAASHKQRGARKSQPVMASSQAETEESENSAFSSEGGSMPESKKQDTHIQED